MVATVLLVGAWETMVVLDQLNHHRLLKVLEVEHLGELMMHLVVATRIRDRTSNTLMPIKVVNLVLEMT